MTEANSPMVGKASRIYIEPWSSEYGSPMRIDEIEGVTSKGELIEEEGFEFVDPPKLAPVPIAFIDGVRRQEASLSQYRDERAIAGIAGSYAIGAVLSEPNLTPMFCSEWTERVVVWSDGASGELPPIAGGWSWREETTGEAGPLAPMHRLQELMRRAEAALGDQLAEQGHLVLLDGTLWFASHYDKRNIAGYVKTHHVRLLPETESAMIPLLGAGQRTSLFHTDANRYACYLRLAPRGPFAPPMAGIVRLEFAGTLPLADARGMADRFAFLLPQYAGVPHVDPRAPQNLQPIGALEKRLRHLLGDVRLAERATRDSVASIAAE